MSDRDILIKRINEVITTEKIFVENMAYFTLLIGLSLLRTNNIRTNNILDTTTARKISEALSPYETLAESSLIAQLTPLKADASDQEINDMINGMNLALSFETNKTQAMNQAFADSRKEYEATLALLQSTLVTMPEQTRWQRVMNRKKLTMQQIFKETYESQKKDDDQPIDKVIQFYLIQAQQRSIKYSDQFNAITDTNNRANILSDEAKSALVAIVDNANKRAEQAQGKKTNSTTIVISTTMTPNSSNSAAATVQTQASASNQPVEADDNALKAQGFSTIEPIAPKRKAPHRDTTDATTPTKGAGIFDQKPENNGNEAVTDQELERLIKILATLTQANMSLCATLNMPVPDTAKETMRFCEQAQEEMQIPIARKTR